MNILNSCAQTSERCLRNCHHKQTKEVYYNQKDFYRTWRSPKNIHIMKEKFSSGDKKSLKFFKPFNQSGSEEIKNQKQEPTTSRNIQKKVMNHGISKKLDQTYDVLHFQSKPQTKTHHRRIESLGCIGTSSSPFINVNQNFQKLPQEKIIEKDLFKKKAIPKSQKVNFCYFVPQTTKALIKNTTDTIQKASILKKNSQFALKKYDSFHSPNNPIKTASSYQELPLNCEYKTIFSQKQIPKSTKYQSKIPRIQSSLQNKRQQETNTSNPEILPSHMRMNSQASVKMIDMGIQHGRSLSQFQQQFPPWQQLIQSSNFDDENHSNARNFSRQYETDEKDHPAQINIHFSSNVNTKIPQNIEQEECQNQSEHNFDLNLSTMTIEHLEDMDACRKTCSIHDSDSNEDQFSDVIELSQKDHKGIRFKKFLTLPLNISRKTNEQPRFSAIGFKNRRTRKQSMTQST